jgi:hypothetical protein
MPHRPHDVLIPGTTPCRYRGAIHSAIPEP